MDNRADFANSIFKLIWNSDDVEGTLEKAEVFINYLEEHVRNIYEEVEHYIPLWYLRNLRKYGASNWGFTDEEYEDKLWQALEDCSMYDD